MIVTKHSRWATCKRRRHTTLLPLDHCPIMENLYTKVSWSVIFLICVSIRKPDRDVCFLSNPVLKSLHWFLEGLRAANHSESASISTAAEKQPFVRTSPSCKHVGQCKDADWDRIHSWVSVDGWVTARRP